MSWTRRALLRAVLVAPVASAAGCRRRAARPSAAPPAGDELLVARARGAELRLLAAYDAVLGTRLPDSVSSVLAALRADHAVHLGRLPSPSPSPGEGRSVTASAAAPPGSPIPASLASVLANLSALELAASGDRADDCLSAGRELAALLGSVAASEASHVTVLGALRTKR